MAAHGSRRLLTCRYWALGPHCPNFDAFGTNTCRYAHYDTGKLASHIEQRGTCLTWRHLGYCGRGPGCWYEHRQTGVTGLYQGTVELTGFELEVADAARKAGFNTFSQDALFELIWAVKRVALRRGGVHWNTVARGPRYQDPIYPDRYRPSGIGDNTKKRRKAIAIKSAPSNFGKVQFHPIKPLMRKRPLHNIAEEHLIDLTSSDNEIDLTSRPTTTSKRQKMAAVNDRPKNTILQIDYGRAGNMGPAVKPKPTCKPAHVQNTPSVSGPSPSNIPPATMTSRQEIVKQLKLVKTKLEDARRNMNICQASMKTLFDLHYDEFDSDEMMMSLQKLSNFMNKVFDGGKDGAGEVDNAIVLLNANKGKMR